MSSDQDNSSDTVDSSSLKRSLTTLNVDLNLLVVLEALLEEKNVTRAANRVCLSQSATSSALNRLRNVFEDPLLVRHANKMELSRRALELVEPINQAIQAINNVLGDPAPFDPISAVTTVRICASDYTGLSLLPALQKELQVQAPGISLYISPLREPEALRRLEKEDVDLVIGHFSNISDTLQSVEIFQERFVAIMRREHPLALACDSGKALSLKQFVAYKHVAIAREGVKVDLIDIMLKSLNEKRTIGMHVPHFLVAPCVVQNSDMIAVEAERLGQKFQDSFDLSIIDLPEVFSTRELPIHMLWEPHTDDNPALKWVRNLIRDIARKL